MTAQDLLELGVIDRIVPEPVGGAHREPAGGGADARQRDRRGARATAALAPDDSRSRREQRFLRLGERSSAIRTGNDRTILNAGGRR